MKTLNKISAALFLLWLATCTGCKKFLDYKPQGTLTSSQVTTADQVDGLVTAAYAGAGNDVFGGPITSMWIYGSVRADDAYKGGGSISDEFVYHTYELYNLVTPVNTDVSVGFPDTWTTAYFGISRVNFALKALNNLTEEEFPKRNLRIGEMRFLRGHLYFVLKQLFNQIPWIDETMSNDDIYTISNTQYTSDELWEKIAADFQFAADNLPQSQPGEPGRANQLSAKSYLAKTRLYQAYRQDADHNVTGIDNDKLEEVVRLTGEVIGTGAYHLNDDYAKNFLYPYENGPESIFAIQYSVNDGTANGRLSMVFGLNYSVAPQYGCCGFHIPSQNVVNAFKTDASGLPMFDTFNDVEMKDSIDFMTNGVDPRFDHTVGSQGHPFKYQPDLPYSHSWERLSVVYGGFGNMKEQQVADCPCLKKVGPFIGSTVNLDILRYDDVLLWRAEALIELGRQDEALPLINDIRQRAKNSTGMLKNAQGDFPSNYRISTYQPGVNIPAWDQATARKALRFERRLEFAMEGPRFFDLVRWGIAAETLNQYLEVEKDRHGFLATGHFTKGRDEYFPIPQREIDLTKGLYKQNPGY